MATPTLSGRWCSRWSGLGLALLGLLLLSLPATASDRTALAPPQQVIDQVSTGLQRVLAEDRERLASDLAAVRRVVDELFLPNIDLQRAAALILGRHWRTATPSQRRAFIAAFTDLVINTYAHAVHEIGPWNIRYLPMRTTDNPDRVVVRTEILRARGSPVAVDYRMIRQDGRWLAYDVLVGGVSLLTNYRSTFNSIARERGLDGLIDELQRRNTARWTGS
ncbi:MAG: ABC transporter substrate-binding protein [Chromatiaceae bacterium]|nr:MAG: ABC transporter substrate-binding protein [Chromatiaceae bacterium]